MFSRRHKMKKTRNGSGVLRGGYDQGRMAEAHTYLKAGNLVQLRTVRRASGIAGTGTTTNRKKLVERTRCNKSAQRVQAVNEEEKFSSPERCPSSISMFFDSDFPQRKITETVTAPSTPSSQMTLIEETNDQIRDNGEDSLLESLPLDLMVRIVCFLQHDQLKPLFHVSKRLMKAVLIARQSHFNFTTPDRERQEKLGLSMLHPDGQWPFLSTFESQGPRAHPATPKAPRHLPKAGQTRLSIPEMRQIAATLFQGSSPQRLCTKPSNFHLSVCRGLQSHRVLFYEEELCQAVAKIPFDHMGVD